MKTSELVGTALDWAVAKCQGLPYRYDDKYGPMYFRFTEAGAVKGWDSKPFPYSSDWSHGGPIIDANPSMQFWMWGGAPNYRPGELQCACMTTVVDAGMRQKTFFGKTKLIAAMRCYVASQLGDEVDVPEGLS